VRFFAHDGKTVHGPSPVEELTRLPGFDGDTLVCPVGSENSADWKPALAYPPFRAALLAPPPRPAPAPPPPAPTKPCPACAQRNPERARFCNACGARMDGGPRTPPPAPAPVPVEPAPVPLDVAAPAAAPEPAPEAPAAVPAPAADPAALRKTLIAAFVGATVASGGLGWWLLRPAPVHVPSGAELNLTPPAPSSPAPQKQPEPPPPAAAPAPSPAPVVAAPPAVPAAPPPPPAAPKTAKRPRAKPAPAKSAAPEAVKPRRVPRAPRARKAKLAQEAPKEPNLLPPAEKAEAPAPAAESAAKPAPAAKSETAAKPEPPPAPKAAPAAPEENGFLLPGVPRRVTASSKKAPKKNAPAPDAPKTETPTDAAPSAAPAPASADGAEDPAAGQVREQFEFCSQLLSQGAYGDHFDTCLCAATRQAAPYKGSRDAYAAAMKKRAAAHALAASADAGGITLEGATATVKTGAAVQRWALEDGLWCRAP